MVLDLDDTIFPEIDFILSGFFEVSRYISQKSHYEVDYIYQKLSTLFNNNIRNNTFDILIEDLQLSNIQVQELVELYRNHKPVLKPWEDALFLLDYLSKYPNKFTLCLISDGIVLQQKNKIKALKIEQYFKKIIITDELGGIEYRKPNPFVFNLLLDQFNISSSQSIYIADNPLKDFIAPNEIGMHTMRIKKAEGIYAKFEAPSEYMKAQITITSLDQAIQAIERICT